MMTTESWHMLSEIDGVFCVYQEVSSEVNHQMLHH